ncbi:MAG: thiamine pyrophosphate-requiring protein [Dehalococcoidales bacterium]|nr:thiamine pyrophosphate-requiring protein [Dehalococcoidales bacterium]
MKKYQRAEAFLEALNANGVETIFMNSGLDVAPIQAATAKMIEAGRRTPRVLLCLHESVALSAAHGHYMVTGKPQVVLVHAELGTLQVGGSLFNAQWGRVPVILFAGRFPEATRKTWQNKAYDQGSIVRNSVKKEYRISGTDDIQEVLRDAFETACADPCGPVYLTHDIGYMTEKINKRNLLPSRGFFSPPLAAADRDRLSRVAGMLVKAENPLIIPGFTGRHAESVERLVELAESLCAPVLTGPQRMNFPTTHPLCAGIEKGVGNRRPNPHISEADVILALDFDMQYARAMEEPRPDAKIIHVGVAPTTQGMALWGRKTDIFIKADTRKSIPFLKDAIEKRLNETTRANFRKRFTRLERNHKKMRDTFRSLALKGAEEKPISPDWLSYCINEVIEDDDIVVNHVISHMNALYEQISRTRPGTFLTCPGGSINWALGAALGAKAGAPGKTVISLMTDGGFVWGCPVAALWSATAYKLPFLSVIFNNEAYGAIKVLLEMMTSQKLSDKMAFDVGVHLTPSPDYAGVAGSCGAYGRKVTDPEEIIPALKNGLARVRKGKPAVLDIRLSNK